MDEEVVKTEVKPEVESKDPNMKQSSSKEEEPAKYFTCDNCNLQEKYEYFGTNPPFYKKYKLTEASYIIEDKFLPPKQGEIIILGSHCIKCQKSVCKDINCSFYFTGTHCIPCAKAQSKDFPQTVRDKLNKLVIT